MGLKRKLMGLILFLIPSISELVPLISRWPLCRARCSPTIAPSAPYLHAVRPLFCAFRRDIGNYCKIAGSAARFVRSVRRLAMGFWQITASKNEIAASKKRITASKNKITASNFIFTASNFPFTASNFPLAPMPSVLLSHHPVFHARFRPPSAPILRADRSRKWGETLS